jgi:uncharacterized membrane protein
MSDDADGRLERIEAALRRLEGRVGALERREWAHREESPPEELEERGAAPLDVDGGRQEAIGAPVAGDVSQDRDDRGVRADAVPPPLPVLPLAAPAVPPPHQAAAQRLLQRGTAAQRPVRPARPGLGLPSNLEQSIGKNWASWIGALLLVLGVTFFLKYAWDQGWVHPTPTMRLAAAVGLGVAVGAVGEWLYRKKMAALAGACFGAGIAIVMASFFGGYVIFDPGERPLEAGGAFVAVAVTALAGIGLALRTGIVVPGAIALVGAYLAPFVLTTGADKSLELLVYLTVLSAVGWALGLLRPGWQSIRLITFGGTWLSFAAWYAAVGRGHDALALGFAAVYFAGFLGEMVVSSRRPGVAQNALAVLSLVNTAAIFYTAYGVLRGQPALVGAIAVGLALVHAGVAAVGASREFKLSSLLQTAGLLTLAVPLVLDRFLITFAWAGMALGVCVLGWLLDVRAARPWAIALWLLAAVRLVVFDRGGRLGAVVVQVGQFEITQWLMFVWGMAMMAHAIAYLRPGGARAFGGLSSWLGLDEGRAAEVLPEGAPAAAGSPSGVLPYARPVRAVDPFHDGIGAALAAVGTLLFLGANAGNGLGAEWTVLALAWAAAVVALMPLAGRIGYWSQAAALLVGVTVKWVLVDAVVPLIEQWDSGRFSAAFPFVNLTAVAGVALVAAIAFFWRQLLAHPDEAAGRLRYPTAPVASLAVWVGSVLFVLLNVEICRTVDHLSGGPHPIAKQVAMSVLWALIGFAAVLVGFGRKIAGLRYFALALLGATLVKVLVVDMAEVKAIWRILSFLAVGALLLAVSFLYHRQPEEEAVE